MNPVKNSPANSSMQYKLAGWRPNIFKKQRYIMLQTMKMALYTVFLMVLFFYAGSTSLAAESSLLSRGQDVYVPAYSHIYHGNKETPLLLSVTLSIRNIDSKNPITITKVDYFETEGALVKQYLAEPLNLGPLGSERFIVSQKDNTGGSGANFIVTWKSDKPTNPPIIETVMIGTQSQLGISFTSRGQPLQ